jgi:tetratricopeptide (TPR) repeat protein
MQPLTERFPELHEPHFWLAVAYEQKGDLAKALAEANKAVELNEAETEGRAQIGHMYAKAGQTAKARELLRYIVNEAGRRHIPVYTIAVLCEGLGERDEAFRWLQKAVDQRDEDIAMINVDPRLEGLHSDPRFAALLRSAGLAK